MPIAALCMDGGYYKYSINSQGEAKREAYVKFLELEEEQ